MKIVFFLPELSGGGAEKIFLTHSREFSKRGHQVDLVLIRKKGELLNQVSDTVNLVDLDKSNVLFSIIPLIKYLRKHSTDILISTLPQTNLAAIIAAKIAAKRTQVLIRISSMISMRKISLWKKFVQRLLVIMIYRFADECICVSHAVAEDISRYALLPLNKTTIIYNPTITPEIFRLSKKNASLLEDLPEGKLIVAVGRLSAVKDFQTLIRAFAEVNRRCNSRLLILGEGEARQQLENLAAELEIQDKVLMPGFIANPYPYLKKADLFVLSSLTEGLPNVLIQALSMDCKIVSTDCPGGVREILNDGKYGILVPVGNVKALANGIIQALGSRMIPVEQQWLNQFSVQQSFQKYLNLLKGRKL